MKPSITISGKATLLFKNYKFGNITFSNRDLKIELADPKYVNSAFKSVPRELRSFRFIHRFSRALSRTGFSIEFLNGDERIIGIGKNHHSLLGSVDVSLLRSLKYFR